MLGTMQATQVTRLPPRRPLPLPRRRRRRGRRAPSTSSNPEFAERYAQAPLTLPPTGSGLTAGIATICTPKRVLAESREPGLLTACVDLDRLRWLRDTDEELIVPAPYSTIPGHLRWRRPELYSELTRTEAKATIG